jgi:hypothetical protein
LSEGADLNLRLFSKYLLLHFILFFRISEKIKERMEIGSGTLEMKLDEELERRVQFWTEIW